MGYSEAMEAAGAVVHEYKSFGDYQGTWWAKVTYNGSTYWVSGSYGSCSGCDAFEAEFGFEHHEHSDDDYYSPSYNGAKEGCEKCEEFMRRLIAFGKSYLVSGEHTQEEAEKAATPPPEGDWDWDEKKGQLAFIKQHTI